MDHTSEPLDRDKAAFSAFAGRKHTLPAGRYTFDISVILEDAVVKSETSTIVVQ